MDFIIDNSIKQFILSHKDWIENKEYQKLYDEFEYHDSNAFKLTRVLNAAGIDPLPYLTEYIPDRFAFNSADSSNIAVNAKIIGVSAFARSNVSHVELSNNLEIIREYAFDNCLWLKEITIPDSVESIGEGAFASSSIQTITLSSSVKSLGYQVFRDATDLRVINYKGNATDFYQLIDYKDQGDLIQRINQKKITVNLI